MMITLSVLLYGEEAWAWLSTNGAALKVFERKFLLKIVGPVLVEDNFGIPSNSELYELLNER